MEKLKRLGQKLSNNRFSFILSPFFKFFCKCQYAFLCLKWKLSGNKKPDESEIKMVCENVTFIYKSFERQGMAKRLYRNIKAYYPDAKVIIADDSKRPLKLKGENLKVINLPFNSGLSYGLNRALGEVETPFLIRLDDDELLTPFSKFGKHLDFLKNHPEVDLVGIMTLDAPLCTSPKKNAKIYYKQSMANAKKPLIIPHLTVIDKEYAVLGKVPNVFIARTDKVKEIGYDDNIRMIDHHEFFYRAAGNIVSVLCPYSFVYHDSNPFDKSYRKYRMDIKNDIEYIKKKMSM